MLSNYSVIGTKLNRPVVTNDLVFRDDLVDKLEQNRYKPLTLVSAPTGYGKSVLVSQWLETTKATSIWISLDEDHNDQRTFLEYLAAGLEKKLNSKLDRLDNLNELGIDDLSFTESDIHQLNKILLNIELSNETIRNLWEKTEGWIVGLRMASLMVSDPKDAEEVYQNISGSMHLISDFLLSEVLSKHPAAFREMLLRTSVLNRFCADLIEETFIKDRTNDISLDAGEFMQWLIQSKIFSIQLDTEQKWVRYHHLFQELLNKELRRSFTTEDIQGSCNRASLWFEKNGSITEAIDYAIEAENYPRALEIIERNWLSTFNQELWYNVENWIQRLPEIATTDSILLLFIKAWIMHSKHQLSELPPILDRINDSKERLRDQEEGYLAFYQCMFTYYSGQVEPARQLAEKALKLIPEEQVRFRSDIGSWFMLILQSLGREDEALERIESSLKAAGLQGDPIVLTRLRAQQVYIHTIGANIFGVRSATREFVNIDGLKGFTLGFSGYFQGCTHWWENDHKGVIKHIELAIKHRYQSNFRLAVEAYIMKAISYQKLGMDFEANREIGEMKAYAGKIKDADILAISGSGLARLALLQGNIAEARNWLFSSEASALVPTEMFWIESPVVTRCRVLIGLGKTSYIQEALQLLEDYRLQAESWFNKLRVIEILILQVVANRKLGHSDLALNKLKKALELANRGSWIRPFVESGDAINSMLNQLKGPGSEDEFISLILEEISKEKQINSSTEADNTGHNIDHTDQSLASSLSKRELEILTLAAQGLKNREIGNKIYVSESTIKTHMYNIFKKLDVNSRFALVLKAQQMGILQEN